MPPMVRRTAAELVRARERLPALSAARHRRPPVRLSGTLFGRAIRRGRLLIRRRTTVVGVAADVDLDLREAEIEGSRVTVSVLVALGNVDVYVPEGIDVIVGGFVVFGRHRHWGRDTARPDAPTILVRIYGCFGTVDVWRVSHDIHGDYREIHQQLEARRAAAVRLSQPRPTRGPGSSPVSRSAHGDPGEPQVRPQLG